MKTNRGLVEYANKWMNLKTVYMWGSFGQLVSDKFITQKSTQYPYPKYSFYSPKKITHLKSFIGKDVYAYDCVGLIKGYLWDGGYDSSQDKSANVLYQAAKVKGNIKTMPDTPGLLVWMEGHIGVYIGNGEVIEATPILKDGVQRTKLNYRAWHAWCECPYITYEERTDLDYYIANIQQKIGLEDQTINYLKEYKYGAELIEKIAKGLR